MFVDIKSLPETSKVWIYQSNRQLLDDEVFKINELLKEFIENWNHHGEGMKSSFIVKYNQFIVIINDESFSNASGCSIDSSVQVLKRIEKEFNIELFDRMKTTFRIGDDINIVSLADFKKYVDEGKISSETIVFNNIVSNLKDFNNKWEVPAKESWHNRYFN